ncbi:hypothetical protein ACIBG0_11215 [Nocardia sp. NPDC050630]|uniref:hypothetical protein n=1 Tax=Nocardia sp. NPDC050630 TaxID=3364321 RepID=UPI0037874BF5
MSALPWLADSVVAGCLRGGLLRIPGPVVPLAIRLIGARRIRSGRRLPISGCIAIGALALGYRRLLGSADSSLVARRVRCGLLARRNLLVANGIGRPCGITAELTCLGGRVDFR